MQTNKYTAAEQAENISKLIAILYTFTPVRPVFHWLYTPLLTPRYSHKSAPFLFSLVK